MVVDHQAALDLMDKMDDAPKFCNPAPSREDWERLRTILSTPRLPTLPNYGAVK